MAFFWMAKLKCIPLSSFSWNDPEPFLAIRAWLFNLNLLDILYDVLLKQRGALHGLCGLVFVSPTRESAPVTYT